MKMQDKSFNIELIVTSFKLCATNINVKLKTILYSTKSHKIIHPRPDTR